MAKKETTDVVDPTAVPAYLQKYQGQSGNDADSMASASVSVPRISLKGKKFQFIHGDDESKKTDSIDIVILAVDPEGGKMIKTFYANGYNPQDTAPPDCSSSDGVRPDGWVQNPQNPTCSNCQKNVFGSATSPSGKKTKACRDAKRLWVVKAEDAGSPEATVYGLNVPVTSLKSMAEYGREIRSAGIPLSVVITTVSMDDDSEFPMIHFARKGFLNEEDANVAMDRNGTRDWIINMPTKPALAAPASSGAPQIGLDQSTSATAPGAVDPSKIDEIAKQW